MNAASPLTVAAALRWPDLAPIDARILLQHVLKASHASLIAHSERTLTMDEARQVEDVFERRRAGEPVAYIVGRREFYGRDFAVTPAVLIPRPETELLVESALERMRPSAAPRVLDLGTGSGCIAISLALEDARAEVVGLDASADALRVAARNAGALGAAKVRLVQGRWFEPLRRDGAFDLVVANPPYVADDDPHLAAGDLRFEPRTALASGPAGLDALAEIVSGAPGCLRAGGWLLLEHGWNQAEAVAGLLSQAGFTDVFMARDLAGQPRVTGARSPTR